MQKKGAIISGLAGIVALGILLGVFVNNASPYMTVAETKISKGDGVHVAGEIKKDTIVNDIKNRQIRFTIQDPDGQTLPVVYVGAPVSNLGSATKVVAVGGMQGAEFHSSQLLVKCPSKYEGAKPAL
jgi:cytochrome c-type biogenesis protein CcmE